jgi:hypothetical protein
MYKDNNMSILNEMAKELVPNLSSKEDMIVLKDLRRLHKKDPMEFEKQLNKINKIRKAEGLRELYKAEVLSKTLEKDVKKAKQFSKEMDKEMKNVMSIGRNHIIESGVDGDMERSVIYFKIGTGESKSISFDATMYGPERFKIEILDVGLKPHDIIGNNEIRFPEIGKRILLKYGPLTGYRKFEGDFSVGIKVVAKIRDL